MEETNKINEEIVQICTHPDHDPPSNLPTNIVQKIIYVCPRCGKKTVISGATEKK